VLWNKFEKAFTDTYMDITKGVKANKDLQELHIKDSNIDTYIATFKKLLKLASYKEDEQGTLKMFKMGLPARLNVLPPRQAAKLSCCGCDPSWFYSPHDMCFIHESCLCKGSSKWPPVKLVRSTWVSKSHEWLAVILSRQ
jgi:hypothetical protein